MGNSRNRPGYNDDWPTCARTYASLRLFEDDLDPVEVSRLLGVEATTGFRRGDVFGAHRGQRRTGLWLLSSQDAVDSRDLRRHVDWLLDAVEPRRDALAALLDRGARGDIFCYWESRHGHGGPELSPSQMARLVAAELPIGLDAYYPDRDPRGNGASSGNL